MKAPSPIKLCRKRATIHLSVTIARSAGVGLLLMVAISILAGAKPIAAQVMPPGYVFVEVSDQTGKPVSGAAVVLYDLEGREIGSSITDPDSRAAINKQTHYYSGQKAQKFIVRITKPGYLTQEVLLPVSDRFWESEAVKSQLIHLQPEKKTPANRPKPARQSKRGAPMSGLSPPH